MFGNYFGHKEKEEETTPDPNEAADEKEWSLGTCINDVDHVYLRIILLLLPIPILMFYCLVLTGCTSPGMSNIHIAKIHQGVGIQISVGYFGMCASSTTKSLVCGFTSDNDHPGLLENLNGNAKRSTTPDIMPRSGPDLTGMALDLQKNNMVGALVSAGILFLISVMFLALYLINQDKPVLKVGQKARLSRIKFYANVARCCQVASTLLVLGVAFNTTGALQGMQLVTSTDGTQVEVDQSGALPTLQWLTFVLSLVFSVAVWYMLPKSVVKKACSSRDQESQKSAANRQTNRPNSPFGEQGPNDGEWTGGSQEYHDAQNE